MREKITIVGLIIGILLFPGRCRAAAITLKSGKTVSGRIVEKKQDSLVIDMDGIPLTYYLDEIAIVDESDTAVAPPETEKTAVQEESGPREADSRTAGEIKKNMGPAAGAAEGGASRPPLAYLKAGIKLSLRGKFAEAKTQLTEGLRLNQNDPNLYEFVKILEDLEKGVISRAYTFSLFKGAQYFIVGKYEDAIGEFKKTVTINPGYPAAYRTLGFAYFLLQRYDEAVPVYEALDRLKPGTLDTLVSLAYCYYALGQNPKAAGAYKKIIDLYPAFTESYNNLGTIYIAMGKYEDALTYLLKLIEINPNIPQAYSNIGTAYSSLEKYPEAMEYYHKALNLDPELVDAHISLAAVYNAIGKTEEARAGFQTAKEIFRKRNDREGITMIDEIMAKMFSQ